MKLIRNLLWQASPLRMLLESWLIGFGLLILIMPVLLATHPMPRSLFLVQLPLICAVLAGFRHQFLHGPSVRCILKESGLALVLGVGVLGIVISSFWIPGNLEAIRYSYAGTNGTLFFIALVVPEYLGVRVISWLWRHWDRLLHRRYAWGLTHAILKVVFGIGLAALLCVVIFIALFAGDDIWGIAPGDIFAQLTFWSSVIILFSTFLVVSGLIILLPPSMLFAFGVARKMTARLENLALGAQALRKGELSTRINVEGEDEVAQLQTDFNAMAADLEKAIQALQTEKEKVWQLLENRRELVAGISHELRNPIATILGYVDSLQNGKSDQFSQDASQDLQTIQYEASRLQIILTDLLTTSQMDADRLSVNLQDVNVTEITKRVTNTFSGLAWNRKRVQVSLTIPAENVIAFADPLRLEQVIVNLVQNAVQHTSAGGLVALEIYQDQEYVFIEIEDTGEGISPDALHYIWDKYYHTESPQDKTQVGMGLGLSLVKELTEAMQGIVSVESRLSQGSTFKIQLPAGISLLDWKG